MSEHVHDPLEAKRRNPIGAWAFGLAVAGLLAAFAGLLTASLYLSAAAIFGGFVGYFEGRRRGLRKLLSILAMAIGLLALALYTPLLAGT